VSGTWAASMLAALAASVGRPRWWAMALAAFLVRGGIVLVLLPLVSLPSAPAVATLLAPTVEALAIGGQSLEAALVWTLLIAVVVGILAVAAYAGTWLDDALAREAEGAAELELRVSAVPPSTWRTLWIRLLAHLPTFLALGYAAVRIVIVTYQELLAPGNPAVPIALRVLGRAPEAAVVVVIAWLVGEAVGGLGARRAAEGETVAQSVRGAIRDLLGRRGAATFVVTDAVIAGIVLMLVTVVGRAAEHLRVYLFDRVDDVSLAAALLLLVTTWVLGLALLGAALAWRATAWTLEAAPRRPLASDPSTVEETAPATGEAAAG
jgi:hypothetical protein